MNKQERIKQIEKEIEEENKKGYGRGPYWNPGKIYKLKKELRQLCNGEEKE